MPIKYLIVDDSLTNEVRPYKDRIDNADKGISLTSRQPVSFEEQVVRLRKDDFDGLILDLRLDQQKNDEGRGKKVHYTAQALAQELRSRMSGSAGGKSMKPVPIVLWSMAGNIEKLFKQDDTAQDLFDTVYQKDTIVTEDPKRVAQELISLAKAYKDISKAFSESNNVEPPFDTLLALENIDLLDPRIPKALKKERRPSVHEVAKFIHRELILVPGPLVDKKILAARLGVDIAKSSDWHKLKKKLTKIAGYKGIFSLVWPRWWWPLIEVWWRENLKFESSLQSLNAEERVINLKAKSRLKNITPAKPTKHSNNTKFWTICLASGVPIDPQDGIRANEPERAPWQDVGYLSILSLLERTAYQNGFSVHPLDKPRWEVLRESIRRNKDGIKAE